MSTDLLAPAVSDRIARIRLLSLDVDGVQTDGGLYYSEDGSELRRFHVRDGMGIVRLQAIGIPVVFITQSATPCIRARAKKLRIARCIDGCEDKLTALKALCQEMRIDLSEVAHMGDDVNDLQVLQAVGCPVTVADAVPAVARVALWTSSRPGGSGAVREFCEAIINLRTAQA